MGSIFVSRLSTALHASVFSATTPRSFTNHKREPSPNVVMITLLFVTIPVEIVFLGVLRLLGWLHLPLLFVGFSIVFFVCAVRPPFYSNLILRLNPGNFHLGCCIPHYCTCPNQLPLVKESRSRHVCSPHTFGAFRPHRPASACALFRDCIAHGGSRPGQDPWLITTKETLVSNVHIH